MNTEQRIEALEKEVSELKLQLEARTNKINKAKEYLAHLPEESTVKFSYTACCLDKCQNYKAL